MNERNEALEHAFRKAWLTDRLEDVRRSWWIVLGLLAAFGLLFYSDFSPRHVAETIVCRADGFHQLASDSYPTPLVMQAACDDGRTITVALPSGSLPQPGKRVRISVIRNDWPPHGVRYRFDGYVEAPAP